MRALLAAALCLLPVLALAQTADPILEEQRRAELERRTNTLGTFKEGGAPPDPGPAQAPGGPCFQINSLTVDGVTLLTPVELAAIVSGYVPRCMQGADIQAVMRALDAAYADRGHITSKTYIPPQNLAAGSLTLTMLEGTVEDVLLIDGVQQIDSPRGRRQLATAFPQTKGRLFQLRDFEQGLDQMNRLASVEAILKLQPGTVAGGSYVIVQRVQSDRFRGYARMDNQGAAGTGRNKLSLDVEVDDLLGANDSWSMALGSTENTNSLSLSASVPYGYWTLSTDLSYSEYLTPLNAGTELFGSSDSAGLQASFVAQRNQRSTTALRFGLQTRRSDRYINGVHLTPQNLTVISLGANHMRLSAQARNSFDLGFSFGITGLGASVDGPRIKEDEPHAQFSKVELGWQRQGALGSLGTLVTDLRVQWSPDSLFGAEQLSLGSMSSVRGYDSAEASGDSGFYLRNDLYLNAALWNVLPDKAAAHMAQHAQPFVFIDSGMAFDRARGTRETAAGLGFGMSYHSERFTASGIVGVPLLKAGEVGIGEPVVQLRFDVKAW